MESFVTKNQRVFSAKFVTCPFSTCVKLRVGGWLRKSSSGMLLGVGDRQALRRNTVIEIGSDWPRPPPQPMERPEL